MYLDYYTKQNGGSVPFYAGAHFQRGHGLGSMLSGLFRRVLPFFRNNAKTFGLGLLKTGMNIADDMIQGKKFVDSAKERVPEGIKRTKEHINWQSGDGFGRARHPPPAKRRKIVSTKAAPKKKKKNKSNNHKKCRNIFD